MSKPLDVVYLSDLDGRDGLKVFFDPNPYGGLYPLAVGDLNNDGFDDVVVISNGQDRVLFGQAGKYDASVDLASLGGSGGYQFDGAGPAAPAGDLNGDGLQDFVFSNRNADPHGQGKNAQEDDSGQAYVVFGVSTGLPAPRSPSEIDGANGFVINGAAKGDHLGTSVSSAGDFNGDGIDDLIVGATGVGDNAFSRGASYILFGTMDPRAAVLDASEIDGVNGLRIDGAGSQDLSGAIVAGIGDFNHDGFDDVVIAAPYAVTAAGKTGAAYVVFGSAQPFPTAISLGDLDGANGFRLSGETERGYMGGNSGPAGDLNGDGIPDLIVASPLNRSGEDATGSGACYILFGHEGPFAPRLTPSHLNGENGFRIDGFTPFSQTGYIAGGVGDFNGDGFDDFVVNGGGGGGQATGPGSVFLIYGHAGGFAPSLDLAALHRSQGFALRSNPQANGGSQDTVISNVSRAGDVNGDGFADLAVAASDGAYLVFGRAPRAAVTRIGSEIDQAIHGGAKGDDLQGLGGADTLVGGKGADLLTGGDGADTFVLTSLADARLGAPDTIADLTSDDRIDVSRIDADAVLAGDQAFDLVGRFHGRAGELIVRYDAAAAETVAEGDVNGDGQADFRLIIEGRHPHFDNFAL